MQPTGSLAQSHAEQKRTSRLGTNKGNGCAASHPLLLMPCMLDMFDVDCATCAVPDAMRLMKMGAENRHVGETRLNRGSSRSHSVFTCVLERHSKSEETGVTNVLFSRLNLIDLAGGQHRSQALAQHTPWAQELWRN
jgi:hypothetical protein